MGGFLNTASMTIETINQAFNETLEEIGNDENEVYSMEFVQHHEINLEAKLKKLKRISSIQFILFLALFLFIILNTNGRFVNIPYEYNRYMFIFLWGIILVNNYFGIRRGRKITQLEQQLLLIGVYKKIIPAGN
jgi:hypothetical protein